MPKKRDNCIMAATIMQVSCRKGFRSPYALGGLQYGSILPAGGRVLILIHGYNTSYEDANSAYDSIIDKLQQHDMAYDHYIKFFYPGSRLKLAFAYAVNRAEAAGSYLSSVIDQLTSSGCDVTVETHSLGARVALSALRSSRIRHLLMMAPAVDDNCFDPIHGEFRGTDKHADHITVFYSARDGVLRYFYKLSEYLLERVNYREAMGLYGPTATSVPPNLYHRHCHDFVTSHSGYRCDPVFLLWKTRA